MVRYSSDRENQTKSCKSRGSNLCVHAKTIVKLPRPSRPCISKCHQVCEGCHFSDCAIPLLQGLAGVPRPNVGLDVGFGNLTRELRFAARAWKWRKWSWTEGLNADSLVSEHPQVNEVPKMWHRTYRAHGSVTQTHNLRATRRRSALEQSRLCMPQPETSKKTSQKHLEKQNLTARE